MIKNTSFILLASLLAACSTNDPQYYRFHPEKLAEVIKTCQQTPIGAQHCEQLQSIAVEINQLIFELQTNTQQFGKKILALQQVLAQKKAQLKNNANNQMIKKDIVAINEQLRERLAIIKWFESPA